MFIADYLLGSHRDKDLSGRGTSNLLVGRASEQRLTIM